MPKIEVPKFRLSRVFADGTREDLQVCPITGLGTDVIMGRRDLLGMGITVSTLLVGLSACGGKKEKAAPPPPPPPATPGPLRAHKTAVSGLTLSSKDDLLVSSGIDDAVKVWTFPSGELRPSTNMPS